MGLFHGSFYLSQAVGAMRAAAPQRAMAMGQPSRSAAAASAWTRHNGRLLACLLLAAAALNPRECSCKKGKKPKRHRWPSPGAVAHVEEPLGWEATLAAQRRTGPRRDR